jgi:hypothetical protein
VISLRNTDATHRPLAWYEKHKRFPKGVIEPMRTLTWEKTEEPIESWNGQHEEVTELSLLLPGWQVAQLESLAHSRGQTVAQLIRLLLGEYLR